MSDLRIHLLTAQHDIRSFRSRSETWDAALRMHHQRVRDGEDVPVLAAYDTSLVVHGYMLISKITLHEGRHSATYLLAADTAVDARRDYAGVFFDLVRTAIMLAHEIVARPEDAASYKGLATLPGSDAALERALRRLGFHAHEYEQMYWTLTFDEIEAWDEHP